MSNTAPRKMHCRCCGKDTKHYTKDETDIQYGLPNGDFRYWHCVRCGDTAAEKLTGEKQYG